MHRRTWIAVVSALWSASCAEVWGFHDVAVVSDDAATPDATTGDGSFEAMPDVAGEPAVGLDSSPRDTATDAVQDAMEAGGNDGSGQGCSGNCVPPAPSGWTGPYVVYFGPTSQSQPACEASYSSSYAGNDTPNASAAQCICSCGTPDCTMASIRHTCGVACSSVGPAPFSNNVCYNVMPCTSAPFWFEGQPGSCAPITTTTMPLLPVSWQNYAIGCQPNTQASNACTAAGDVCIPSLSSPSTHEICVQFSGSVSCPSSGSQYSVPHVEFKTVADTRSCPSTCTCGAPAGCTGQVNVFTSSNCTGAVSTYAVLDGTTCYNSQIEVGGGTVEVVLTGTGSSCQPAAATVPGVGNVTGATATTFCCLP